jgi:hypothetical protein
MWYLGYILWFILYILDLKGFLEKYFKLLGFTKSFDI